MQTLTILTMVLFLAGCSKTATIYLKDGTKIEGEIEKSDASSIYLVDNTAVFRAHIQDISHPGTTEAAVGTALFIVGSAVAIGGYFADIDGPRIGMLLAVAAPGVLVAASGIPFAVWGWYTWSNSRSAASSLEEPAELKITPVALSDGERTYWGLGMSWRW